MKRALLFFASTILSFSVYAQKPGCTCTVALEKLITKVEREYPGFAVKTAKKVPYEELRQKLSKDAESADAGTCEKVLKSYTDFFRDPHLWVGSNGSPFASGNSGPAESIAVDIPGFRDKISATQDPAEGIWSMEGYKIGVKKGNENEYIGFIVEAKSALWKAGDIKFRLLSDGSFEYIMLDRSKIKGRYKLYNEGILFLDALGTALVRTVPPPSVTPIQVEERVKEIAGFYFKRLSASTSLLKLPSFEYEHMAEIDSLISQNSRQIEESGNLIIDLRGNPGGTTDAYRKLLPYISGKSIRNTNAEFLATQTYIENLQAYKKTLGKDVPTDGIDGKIKELKANLGKFVNFSDADKPIYIEEVALAAKSPQHIVVLADKGTGSSAEYFLFIAKQSKKVKLLGTPSYGALDYGNAYLIDFGCPGYQVLMPTYRAMRLPDYPIDNIGIQPDIYLDSSVEDWVGFAQHYLED